MLSDILDTSLLSCLLKGSIVVVFFSLLPDFIMIVIKLWQANNNSNLRSTSLGKQQKPKSFVHFINTYVKIIIIISFRRL